MDRRYKNRMEAHFRKALAAAIRDTRKRQVSGWFDLWHTHIDWKSKGNRFPENRAMVARLTYELLLATEAHFAPRSEAIQIFAVICEDTGSNAVYVHTENPNGAAFPYDLSHVEWGAPEPPELIGAIDGATYESGRKRFDDGQIDYVIRKRKSHGSPQ